MEIVIVSWISDWIDTLCAADFKENKQQASRERYIF